MTHITGSKRRCWLREKTTKCLWQEASPLCQRQQNSTLNACSDKSLAYVTNNKRLYSTFCTVEANYWQTRSIAASLWQQSYLFHVVVEGAKRCLPAAEFSYDFWYGSWGPPNLPKVTPMANDYIHTECYYTEGGCTFPPNIFAPTPKITPKTSLWGTFQCKRII